jgi:hypothetical protein
MIGTRRFFFGVAIAFTISSSGFLQSAQADEAFPSPNPPWYPSLQAFEH